ncbi:hypothetical protein NMY22_g11037 [Coprinellus aureogranulatus]|nr:hypothetical protein NMY22_g11037 [Coprinellus aureogranulatus]
MSVPGEVIQVLHIERGLVWFGMGLVSVYVYHCLVTMDEEVRLIWSKSFTVGKSLYLLTKYSPIAVYGLQISMFTFSPSGYGYRTCKSIRVLESVTTFVTLASADGMFWLDLPTRIPPEARFKGCIILCIYALLGAKRKYAWFLGVLFWVFAIPMLVLSCIFGFRTLGVVRERHHIYSILGDACIYRISGSLEYPMALVSLYLASTLVIRILYALSTILFFKDGGYNYIYRILWVVAERFDTFLAPILSAALILNLRVIDNPSSKAVISALVFVVDDGLADLDHNGRRSVEGWESEPGTES